jgi:predicted  nucleic acid-binding Zn-ribbon protein
MQDTSQITTLMAQVATKPSISRVMQLEAQLSKEKDQIDDLTKRLAANEKNDEQAKSEWSANINALREKTREIMEWKTEVDERTTESITTHGKNPNYEEWLETLNEEFVNKDNAVAQWRRVVATVQVLTEEVAEVKVRLDEKNDLGQHASKMKDKRSLTYQ